MELGANMLVAAKDDVDDGDIVVEVEDRFIDDTISIILMSETMKVMATTGLGRQTKTLPTLPRSSILMEMNKR